ncbi:MAG: calcium/sodium antiporter [Parvibaculales bacterium]
MDTPFLLLLSGFIVLGLAGEALLRGAVTVATGFKVPPLIIGLTIIAFGTSAPELTVSLNAALGGQPDISIGNVVGSNIANILLVLGAMAVVSPFFVNQGTLGRDGGFMLGVSIVLLLFGLYGGIPTLAGALLLAVLVGFTIYLYTSNRSSDDAAEAEAGVDENLVPGGLPVAFVVLLLGLAGVIWGAELMVDGAVGLARRFGIPEAVIALSLVAIGTSLPELAVSLVAAMRGHAGLAVGNIIGSNISNILLILGGTALLADLPISTAIAYRDLPIMVAVAWLGLFFMASGRRMSRREGIICLALYGSYMGFIFTA